MDWTIQTTSGYFEGSKIKQLMKEIVEHYFERGRDVEQIKEVCCYYGEKIFKVCEKGIGNIQEFIEEELSEYNRRAMENDREIKALIADYYSRVL